MFTGIVEATAEVLSNNGNSLQIARPQTFTDLKIGASISVSGVCLSIVGLDDSSMSFDVIPETVRKTKLGSLKPGSRVNLERAMKADARLDGHIVQGHVEGVGTVVAGKGELVIDAPEDLLLSVLSKGSIAIDGVSLTVARIEGDRITIALIPHTIQETTLGQLQEGDRVNIETDVLAKYGAKRIEND